MTFEVDTGSPDLTEVLAYLDSWCEVVDATTDGERTALLNTLLAKATAHPRLTNHVGDGWHRHFREVDITYAHQLRALISTGTALHLVGRGMRRLGRCAADDCAQVYADVSRNGRQRYCSPACGNRDAVRRHRARAT